MKGQPRRTPALVAALALAACGGPTPSPSPDGEPLTTPQLVTRAPTGTATDAPTTGPTSLPTTGPTVASTTAPAPPPSAYAYEEFDVPRGSHPHDVAPAADGTVWYTGQRTGTLGLLEPATGEVTAIPLGQGSAPHGVIVGPDGAAWVTDAGLNAIIRVDGATHEVTSYPLPTQRRVGLNTAAFDSAGTLWFTGQGGGVYGSVIPTTGEVAVFDAPRGSGPYGIAATPAGEVWYVSLAGSYLALIDSATGDVTTYDPPTAGAGLRRVWSDSRGRLWVSEWYAGRVGMYDLARNEWREWRLPGQNPQAYSVYVDELDLVWLTDFGSNSLVRFDPVTETFESFALPTSGAAVRQQLGRPGEVWGAESATDKLVVLRWP